MNHTYFKQMYIFALIIASMALSLELQAASTFKQMKNDESKGGWEVIWSESYGFADAAILSGCVYFGCAQNYLGYKLDELKKKIGKQLIEQALRNKGKVMFGPGKLKIEAGTAFWSTYYKVYNPLKGRHEKVTTDRYVRLFVKYRRKNEDSSPSLGRHVPWDKNLGDKIISHRDILEGSYLSSGNKKYKLVIQGDGNLVIYEGTGSVWATNSNGKGYPPFELSMQGDGNLVIYDGKGNATWASNTNGKGKKPFTLLMQNDRNLVIYDSNNKATWASNTVK